MIKLMRKLMLLVVVFAGVAGAEVLVAGYQTGMAPPYLLRDGDKVSGIMIEIAQMVAERANLDIELQGYPRARIEAALVEGEIDINIRSNPAWTSNTDLYQFSSALFVERNQIVSTQAKASEITTYTDLAGMVIGGQLGFVYAEEFNRGVENGLFIRDDVQLVEQNYRKLLTDRVEGFINADIPFYYDQQQNIEYAELGLSPLIISENSIHLAMRKDNSLVHLVNQAVDELIAEGSIQAVVESYR